MKKIVQKIEKETGLPKIIKESLPVLEKNLAESDVNFAHSLRTGLILQEMGTDEETIACGILHHVSPNKLSFKNVPEKNVETIRVILQKVYRLRTLSALEKNFKTIPLKKFQKMFLNQQAENLRRMFFAVTQDIRPILVVLAGRLDEVRNFMEEYDKNRQLRKSQAAIEILAPLAYGMGMGEIKGQLEDAAFPYLYPKEYTWLTGNTKEKYSEAKARLKKVKPQLKKILTEKKVEILDIHARAKHYFSLYQKLLRNNMDIDRIYDLVALRIIVPNISACYRALGAIHNVWKPMPGRIKDYISSPKQSGYRSLHTTVICPGCRDYLEIQIKTPRMHREAEYGIAAHLGYKERLSKAAYKYQFYWLDKLRKWREEIKEPQKISEHLKTELFKDQLFVLTPKGDVINLPKGSTPIDFAYTVHTWVGEHCTGAKVNGKMVSFKQVLKTGETIEIITDKNKTPSSDWLRFVKTHKAKAKIKDFLEKAHGISFAKPKTEALKKKVSAIKKIIPLKRLKEPHVLIGGESGISVKFSKCCQPKPGDKISAFVSTGKSAALHKFECANLKEIQEKWPHQIVKAAWASKETKTKK